MKPKARPYGVYRHSQYWKRPGYWERIGLYKTMEAADQAMKEFTKTRRETRFHRYHIFPAQTMEKWLYFIDHEQLWRTAR